MNLINLTPHPVNMLDNENKLIKVLPKCEVPPRLKQETKNVGEINGFPLTETKFGTTEHLPKKQVGVFLIVSRLVLAANPKRTDLIVPNDLVRNEKGHIVGCKSFAIN